MVWIYSVILLRQGFSTFLAPGTGSLEGNFSADGSAEMVSE